MQGDGGASLRPRRMLDLKSAGQALVLRARDVPLQEEFIERFATTHGKPLIKTGFAQESISRGLYTTSHPAPIDVAPVIKSAEPVRQPVQSGADQSRDPGGNPF